MAVSRPVTALPLDYELSEYRILDVLGQGGFGVTYMAEDTRLGAMVAIKEYFPQAFSFRDATQTISPKPDTTGTASDNYQWGLDEFLKEARALARFKHPHIVRVLRFLETNGTAYMVMEYEEGEPLSGLLKRTGGYLNEHNLLNVFLPILSGLQAVHDAGLLHLDIKPDNIYLRSNGQPMLIDFGSARQTKSGGKDNEKIALTPGYSAIEQYPNSQQIGPWSDVYSVGATLYRCVVGRQPVDSMERYRVIHQQKEDDPLAPATSFERPIYSKHIRETIDRATRLNPKHRPQSAKELQNSLMGQLVGAQKDVKKPSYNFRSGFVGVIKTGVREEKRERGFFERLFLGLLSVSLIGAVALFMLMQTGVVTEAQLREAHILAANVFDVGKNVFNDKYVQTEEELKRALRIREFKEEPVVTDTGPKGPIVRKRQASSFEKARQEVRRLGGHGTVTSRLVFAPDSTVLVSASANGAINLWNVADGAKLQSFQNPDANSDAVDLSADGRWLARADRNNSIVLWSLEDKREAQRLVAHIAPVTRLMFSPDARMLASYDNSGQLLLWSLNDFSIKQRYPIYENQVTTMDFGPNSQWFATGDSGGQITYWSITGRKVGAVQAHNEALTAIAFSPASDWLVSAGKNGFLKLWSLATKVKDIEVKNAPRESTDVMYTPDGSGFLLASDAGLQLWDMASARVVHQYGNLPATAALELSYDGRKMAVAGKDGIVRILQ
ncbi:MAG: serine/threonine protein kinase [Gammaproteobacteria bacterium]|nr:serine/threonine protein kinase [Gammaproteobacteria bacterium]